MLDINHHSYVEEKLVHSSELMKQNAYKIMKELHGWCSEEKACCLVDFILLTKPKKIVEIGVFGGKSLVPMALALKYLGEGKIYGIDPWTKEASIQFQDDINREYWSKIDHNMILDQLNKAIYKHELRDQISLFRGTSEDAPPIDEIDILHIDGNHSVECSLFDLQKWVPLVRKGGLIIFEDLYWNYSIAQVVWLNENCIPFSEYTGTNIWGVWIKS